MKPVTQLDYFEWTPSFSAQPRAVMDETRIYFSDEELREIFQCSTPSRNG